jgi:hypothetical protein
MGRHPTPTKVNIFDPSAKDLIRPHPRVLNDDQDVVERLFANGHQLCFALRIKNLLTFWFSQEPNPRSNGHHFPLDCFPKKPAQRS